jgi:hypothetical protein
MTEMSNKEIKKFLMQCTFTGKLATVKKDGSSRYSNFVRIGPRKK